MALEFSYDKTNNINEYLDNKINSILHKQNNNTKHKTILILSGGGIAGIVQIGALKALEEKNILKHITTYAGTSIGGHTCALLNIGYSPDEMYKFIKLFYFSKLRSIKFSNFLTQYGLDNGEKYIILLEKLFNAKNISPSITFKELFEMTHINLILTAVCLNDKSTHYLSHKTYPNMKVITGIRMTTSIPIWFTPVMYNNKLFIDGGTIDNYPIHLFRSNIDSVIGIYIGPDMRYTKNVNNAEDFIIGLFDCLRQNMINNCLKGYEKQTIKIINYTGTHGLDFDVSDDAKQKMYDIGYSVAMKYLKNEIVNDKGITTHG